MKTREKFLFLIIVVAAAAFVRAMYPSISNVPSLADAGDPGATSTPSPSAPPLLELPQTAVAASVGDAPAATAPDNDGSTPANSVFTRIAVTSVPKFNSQAYMVADLTTGAVLAGGNINTRWPTASITKLLTATLIFDQLPTSTAITITPQMFSVDPNERTLVVGGTYTVEDLLHLLLMPSSNVAAEAMADYIGHDKFMAEMNARAREWGMADSYFDDTSGISAGNQSTAHDLFTLAQHVYNDYPGILALTDTPQTTITNLATDRTIPVRSINVFAGEPVFVGGKTGNTPQAGANLLSIFSYHGKPVIIIILGEQTIPFGDTTRLYDWFRQDFQ